MLALWFALERPAPMDGIAGGRLEGAGGDHACLARQRAAVRGAKGEGHVLFNHVGVA